MAENPIDHGSDDALVKTIRQRLKEGADAAKAWRAETRELYDFVAGRQYSEQELAYLEANMRAGVVFNRMSPIIDAVVGHQINNRTEARYFPRENGDAKVSDIITGAAQWADDGCDADDEISDAFWDLALTGMGWTETYMSYDEDYEGKLISAERIPPLEMLWDHSAKKRNLTDARWIARERWIDRTEAEQRWPVLKKYTLGDDSEPVVDEPHDASRAWLYENDASGWYSKGDDEVLVTQYQWNEHKPLYLLGDPQAGRVVELTEAKFNKLFDVVSEGVAVLKGSVEGNPYRFVRTMRKTFFQAFLAGPILLSRSQPCPTHFTFHCMTGKRDASKRGWYGLGRVMKDPQRWSNKFFSDIQDILANNRRGGAFVEIGALVDPKRAEEQWNDTSPLILLNEGAISGGKILERRSVDYPVGLDRLMQFAVQSIPDVTGVNMELMGLVDRNQPGILEAQRKRAAMTILATLFAALRRYQKERGRTVFYFIREYLSDGRLIRIMGEDGDPKYVPLVREDGVDVYDIVIDDAPTSTNRKEETFAVIQSMLPAFQALGVPPPPDVFKHLPIPQALADEWRQSVDASRQAAQQQQAKAAELAEQLAQTELRNQESDTMLKTMKAMAEAAKVQAEQMDAVTKRVMAISEILERTVPTPKQESDNAPEK